jgi:hypothetical protein
MKLRVNLLKSSERRYQGPVSLRFLIRVGGISVVVLALLFGIMAIQRQFMLSHRLKSAKEEWSRLGPRYEEITKRQVVVGNYKALLDELGKWGMTNGNWHEMLLEMQKIVPANVQVQRMTVDTTWEFIKPEKKKKEEKKEEKKKEEHKEEAKKEEIKAAPKDILATPARSIRLAINGSIKGDLADEIIVQFTRNLQKAPGFDVYFDTMELEKLYRAESAREAGGDWRQFEIQGISKPRLIPFP